MGKIERIYGIKFPFTADNEDGLFIDVDKNIDDKVASRIVHVILTTKGTRLRNPEFGTDLVKYIFDPSDDMEWDMVKEEVTKAVSTYVKDVTLNNISVIRDDSNDNGIYMKLEYTVNKGNDKENKILAVRL